MKLGIVSILILFNLLDVIQGENILSDAMKQGITQLGESCRKSVGATNEDVNTLRKGPPYQKKASCVLACILEKAGIMEGKSFSKKGFMLAVTPFIFTQPEKVKKMRQISSECDNEIKEKIEDECDAGGHVVICLKKHIPQLAEIKF